jgi:hypothetical protein
MPEYRVAWSIELTADTPTHAALRAYDSFCRPGSIAHVFDVHDGQRTVHVDIDSGRDTDVPGEPVAYPMSDHLDRHWDDHPQFPVADWQNEVRNGDTRLGYNHWHATKIEENGHG